MELNKMNCNVVFDENMKSTQKIINEWFKRGKIKHKRLDLILSKLDFDKDGEIFISNNPNCAESFYYSVTGEENSVYNDVLLISPRQICVRTYGKETLYEYVEDSLAKDGFRMIKLRSRRHYNIDGNSCFSEFLSQSHLDSNSLMISNNDFSIRLDMSFDSATKLSRLEATELDNYLELEKYLANLTLPCSILDVYRKICEISLTDVSRYHSLSLLFYSILNGDKKIVTNRICLGHGKLCELKITTQDGKVIVMDQNGNFSYTLADESLIFSISELANNQVSYSVKSNNDKEIDDYIERLMAFDISTARRELSDTKKRVRTIFNNPKR